MLNWWIYDGYSRGRWLIVTDYEQWDCSSKWKKTFRKFLIISVESWNFEKTLRKFSMWWVALRKLPWESFRYQLKFDIWENPKKVLHLVIWLEKVTLRKFTMSVAWESYLEKVFHISCSSNDHLPALGTEQRVQPRSDDGEMKEATTTQGSRSLVSLGTNVLGNQYPWEPIS